MQKKITIIGAGSVGATTAFALLTRGAASEVVLIDINTEKARGEALDIKQATPFIDNCNIYAGSYADAANSDVVVITSGIGRKPGQTRLELVQTNVGIIKSIAPNLTKYAPKVFEAGRFRGEAFGLTKYAPSKIILGFELLLRSAPQTK